jgi:hypothetical protein
MPIPNKFSTEYKKFLDEKYNFPREQWIFLGKKPKFFEEKDTTSREQFIFPEKA